jgi:hypothetical protein
VSENVIAINIPNIITITLMAALGGLLLHAGLAMFGARKGEG